MTAPPANPLLDLRHGVGRVAATWRWDLVNQTGSVIGNIYPERGASITNDTTGTIYRTARNVRIRQSEWADINPFITYVRPWMILGDGTQWPQGLFAFTADEQVEGSREGLVDTTLVDLRFLLDQTMPFSFGLPNGAYVYPAMVAVAEYFNIANHEITDTGTQIGGGPVAWPPDATGLQVLESLCQRCGFHPPYFDNNGVLVMRPPVALQLGAGHVYNRRNGRIRRGGLKPSRNLLTAPNAFKVISAGSTGNEISATAYIDPTLPHSREQRGSIVTKVIRRQGLRDRLSCFAVAAAFARQSAAQYATVTLESVPDPRHDTFDIVEIDGDPYREVSWTMAATSGGVHSHRLVKDTVSE